MNPKKLVRKIVPSGAVKQLENAYRSSRGSFWKLRYGFPAKSLKVIAVTGTNGKTTTCSYVNSVLKAGGLKTAVYTTAFYEVDGDREPNRTHMTVTSQKSVQSFFARARKEGVDYVILEVTSHALDQSRIAGTPIEIGIITNLTQEHLDYHGTMENYAAAKARLIGDEYAVKTAILNNDDDWFKFFISKTNSSVLSFGKSRGSDLKLKKISSSKNGSKFQVKIGKSMHDFETRLLGEFNVYNSLAAIGVGTTLGLNINVIEQGIRDLNSVPGRMEEIDEGQNFKVLVDFAITPDALENALNSLRPVTEGKLRIVFGATGDRDATKRPAMGEVVTRLADEVYLTDDETYSEDPEQIRKEVLRGIKDEDGEDKTQIFDDRLDAIIKAFQDSKSGDTVLLTGIGHENYRNMGGKKVPWDERQIAKKLLG